MMSDIQNDLKQVERSLSSLSSHVGFILSDGPDAKPKLIGLGGNIEKLQRDVRNIRMKLNSRQMY